MRAGFFAALFFSVVFALFVQAAPSPVQERDLLDNVETAVEELFSVTVDIKSILSVATPIVESVFSEATSEVGKILDGNPGLVAGATSIIGEVISALGPTGTAIANDIKAVVTPNGALQDMSAMRPLAMGAATVLGSMLFGAYVAL